MTTLLQKDNPVVGVPVMTDPLAKFKELVKLQIHRQMNQSYSDGYDEKDWSYEQTPERKHGRPKENTGELRQEYQEIKRHKDTHRPEGNPVETRCSPPNLAEINTQTNSPVYDNRGWSYEEAPEKQHGRQTAKQGTTDRTDRLQQDCRQIERQTILTRDGTPVDGRRCSSPDKVVTRTKSPEVMSGIRRGEKSPNLKVALFDKPKEKISNRECYSREQNDEFITCAAEGVNETTSLNVSITTTIAEPVTGVATSFAANRPSHLEQVCVKVNTQIEQPDDLMKDVEIKSTSPHSPNPAILSSLSHDQQDFQTSIHEGNLSFLPCYRQDTIDSVTSRLEETNTIRSIDEPVDTTYEEATSSVASGIELMSCSDISSRQIDCDPTKQIHPVSSIGIEELECILQVEERPPPAATFSRTNCLFSHLVILSTLGLSFFAKFAIVILPDFSISCSALQTLWSAYAGMFFDDMDKRSYISYPRGPPPL